MISRELSASQKGQSHDLWACINIYKPHSGEIAYIVCGWDDGQVTFVPFGDFYERTCHTAVGTFPISAPPGSAGIPKNTPTVRELQGNA
jgi:hypothetical protein